MYSLLLKHETKTLVRTPAFAWILLLLAAAVAIGAWAGGAHLGRIERGASYYLADATADRAKLRSDLERYEERVAARGEQVQIAAYSHTQRGAVPQGTNAGSVGVKAAEIATLPPTGIQAFSVGQSDLLLSYVPVTTAGLTTALQASEMGNPVNLKRGPFDLSFVVIFLLPIFILAISYDMLSSEKERGTLAMVLANPLSLQKLMSSKVVSRAVIILGVIAALGFGSLLTVGTALGEPDTWARFGVWLAATLLYAVFWFLLSVFVNALGRNSATNGIILAGAWLAFVVVIPTLVSVGATTMYPAPSRFDFITASREAQTDSERNYMRELNQYYYDHVEHVPEERVNDFLSVTRAKNDAVERAVAPLFAEFRSQQIKQDQLVSNFQFVSPAIMMQRVLNDVTGVSAARYHRFVDQVQAFREQWVSYFTVRFLTATPMRSAEFDEFPKFQYEEEPVSAVVTRSLPSIGGIIVILVLLGGAAMATLRRYQVASR
ncbi:MAG: ABC transporter permease subunit [Terricaulis sp.]|nr:ABC transporter permease subunit [Terricaulis sp.]